MILMIITYYKTTIKYVSGPSDFYIFLFIEKFPIIILFL